MSGESYLQGILAANRAPTGVWGPGPRVRDTLLPLIQQWAGAQLGDLKLSGSYAKGTAVAGGTDVDLFIALRPTTTETLREIYESLATYLTGAGYSVRRQNVSLGITHSGLKIDMTPGKQQSSWTTDHSIYVRRLDSWMQTNVDKHVQVVSTSGQTDLMVLAKRWRQCHSLDFLSFAIELAALRATASQWGQSLETRMLALLSWLQNNINSCALLDPANSNNNLADELTHSEKRAIATAASHGVAARTWGEVVW